MNLALFLPEISLAAFAVLVIVIDLFTTRKDLLVTISAAGLAVSAVISMAMWGGSYPAAFGGMLLVDNFAIFFKVIFAVVAFLIILASRDYVNRMEKFQGEYYALIMLATLGMYLMAATGNLVAVYVALELASISLYALVGFLKDGKSTESSLKYLLLGAVASAVLLYGMALIFGYTGTTSLSGIAAALDGSSPATLMASPALLAGMVLMIAGFGFKIAAVPFQMWVPDVYEGAPTTITAFLSVASKAAGFAVIIRVFSTAFGGDAFLSQTWGMVFAVLAIISMTVGNLSAIPQTNIKRLLGYSSIAQAGYLMVGLAAAGYAASGSSLGQSGVMFFLASYAVTNIGAFLAIIAIANRTGSDNIADYAGMIKRSPVLALALTLCLISLIGMPPASGFIAKFYIFSAAVKQGLLWLVIIAVLNSVISAYYYLRVVKVMWFGKAPSPEAAPSSPSLRLALALACVGVLLLGVLPGTIMKVAEISATVFSG
ncbi:NADH-quinone oxidoreductase subunit N [Chloroflexota bacterium]